VTKVKIKPPKHLKKRLRAVGKQHDLGSVDDVVHHMVSRGLLQYDDVDHSADLGRQLNVVVVEMGYSSIDELIEHLLVRGLGAYEQPDADPERMRERLRGLGYID
jgi:hypothetical protein